MKARIYQPSRNAMQSGEARTHKWRLDFLPDAPLFVEPLMGWTGMTDTVQEVKLFFPTKEEAIAYAQKNNIEFEVVEKKNEKTIKPKSYSANFAYNKVS
ncbi:MAG TPA: ETC complex I subunit [Rickettsiales bacterium]|nr:ETC complex I subunit [Rickettsiales bacterium]